MTMAPDTQIGPYKITREIGRGGMGVVFLARDTKLDRDVAIKALPPELADDKERLERFEREAKLLASLNHPHIATIFGLEEADGNQYLILEYVEGETLAERLDRCAIPVAEALPIAKQIAEAIEAAHEKGVIHRDLKPANIKFTSDDQVKVLDFGLAKSFETQVLTDTEIANSPTLVPPGSPTITGVILGTAGYLSPEQARGRPVDKRADIFAFGCVLFEMLTGEKLFAGETVSDSLASTLKVEPTWAELPADLPPTIHLLLQRCLAKDPQHRLRDIGDARLELEEPDAGLPKDWSSTSSAPASSRHWPLVATGVAVASVLAFWLGSRITDPSDFADATNTSISRMTIDLSGAPPIAFDARAADVGFDSPLLDISPDGSVIVYVGEDNGESRLYARRLDEFDVHPVPGTEGAIHPFFSPDGESIAFFTNEQLKVVDLDGGAPRVLADIDSPYFGSWLADGWIYVSSRQSFLLERVRVDDGERQHLFDGDGNQRIGQVLPGGEYVLTTVFTNSVSADYAEIRVVSLADKSSRKILTNGYDARVVASGHLLFGRAGDLYAVGFDLADNEVIGEPYRVTSDVRMNSQLWTTQVAVSATGVLAYAPGGDAAIGKLAWVDRQGQTDFLPVEEQFYGALDLSPDGRRVAVQMVDVTDYILIYEFGLGEILTLRGAAGYGWPRWSRGGDRIAFLGWPDQILVYTLNAGRSPEVIFEHEDRYFVNDWGPGDATLVLSVPFGDGIEVVSVDEATPSRPAGLLELKGVAFLDLDPSERWVARFTGNGIEVVSLDDGGTYQVSQGFGIEPRWCRGCDELFYRRGNQIFSVRVAFEPEFRWDAPELAFKVDDFIDTAGWSYDVTPDGQRLLVVKRAREMPRHTINLIQNWTAALPDEE